MTADEFLSLYLSVDVCKYAEKLRRSDLAALKLVQCVYNFTAVGLNCHMGMGGGGVKTLCSHLSNLNSVFGKLLLP